MARNRYLNTKLWSDSWVADLDPVEKLMFVYLLTNERTNICGVYELPLKYMSIETGIEKAMLEKILARFERDEKVYYIDGWVCIVNFVKHQESTSPTVMRGIELAMNEVPKKIMASLKQKGIGYGYPMDTLSISPEQSKPQLQPQLQPQHTVIAFEKFWSQYPRKVSKKAAEKSWDRIKPNAELAKKILSALEQYKQTTQWVKDDGRFIPHPATWLNQERWNDDIDPPDCVVIS